MILEDCFEDDRIDEELVSIDFDFDVFDFVMALISSMTGVDE